MRDLLAVSRDCEISGFVSAAFGTKGGFQTFAAVANQPRGKDGSGHSERVKIEGFSAIPHGGSEPLVPFDEKCGIRREGWKADFQRPAIHSSDGFWSRVVSARKCEGVFPVHCLNARVSADGLDRPTRNPICAIGVLVFATSSTARCRRASFFI